MEMLGIAAVPILLANLWAIVCTLRSDASRTSKIRWVALVLLLPFVGVVLWILSGPS